jgi:2-haloacid dehalogenase
MIIAFDVFGTVFDLSLPKESLKKYGEHIENHQTDWAPLELGPEWYDIKAHPDVDYIKLLRTLHKCVTLSNGPIRLLDHISRKNNIQWDYMIPLELMKIYKPNPRAYLSVCELYGVKPEEVLMVSANNRPSQYFRDLEVATELGMKTRLIRHGYELKDLWDDVSNNNLR